MMTSRHPNSSSQRVPAWNSAFNNRDIDGALELMTEDVNWHNASEGIRRQWSEFDPHVEPLAMVEEDGEKVPSQCTSTNSSRAFEERSFRTARSFTYFTVNNGLIAAMDLGVQTDPTAGPSAAFAHRLHSRLPGTQHELITLRIFEDC